MIHIGVVDARAPILDEHPQDLSMPMASNPREAVASIMVGQRPAHFVALHEQLDRRPMTVAGCPGERGSALDICQICIDAGNVHQGLDGRCHPMSRSPREGSTPGLIAVVKADRAVLEEGGGGKVIVGYAARLVEGRRPSVVLDGCIALSRAEQCLNDIRVLVAAR